MKLYLIFVGFPSTVSSAGLKHEPIATILVNRKPGPGYADEEVYKPINRKDLITYLFTIAGYKWRIEK